MALHMQYSQGMSDIQQAVSKAIVVKLTRMGQTQSWLASKLDRSPMWLSNRLTGRVPLNTNDIAEVATGLGVEPFDLLAMAREEASASAA